MSIRQSFDWYDPTFEGLDRTGVIDAQPAIQAAINKVESGTLASTDGGVIVLPPGRFRLSASLVITSTITFRGSGKYQTVFLPDAGVTAFDIENRSLGSRNFDRTSLNNYEMGSHFAEFLVTGTHGDNQTGVVFRGGIDHFRFSHVAFFTLDQAMRIADVGGAEQGGAAANMRESGFHDVTINLCGSATQAALEIVQPVAATLGDGTNHLAFYRLEVLYSRGVGILISCPSTTEEIRRISFHKLMLHGSDQATIPVNQDIMVIEGKVTDVQIYGLMTNGSEAGSACIRIRAIGNLHPRGISILGSIGNCAGDGIVVEQLHGGQFILLGMGDVVGDLVTVTAGAVSSSPVTGPGADKPLLLEVDSHTEAPATLVSTYSIAASERPFIRGYWDDRQRLNGLVEVVAPDLTVWDLNIPNAGAGGFVTVGTAPATTVPFLQAFVGDGVATSFGPTTHNLATTTPSVAVFVDGVAILDGWSASITDANNVTVDFGTAPANTAAITVKASS